MVSSNDRANVDARSSSPHRYLQWITALGGLAGLGTLIAALVPFFGLKTQPDSSAHATDGVTTNHVLQTNGSGQQATSGAGTINQSNHSGNSGVVITGGTVTVLGGGLQQNGPRNTTEHAPSFKPEKYVDVRAARIAGTTNIAIALHGGSGSNVAPLENAMRQALSKRGFSVIPFFREPFKREGLAEKLYNGDPELAGRLMLRRHCDSVLLGVLRFGGPAENVNGLYIREAVLDIHAIDPGTGQIINSFEIREKGGGSTAELSTTNAMIRLEEQVETNLSEWSWI